jgi:L-threonylcarbamoyladenylate synthase
LTRVPVRTASEIEAALPLVLAHLSSDGLIAYPTETVYGFGGALTPTAAARLRALKRRDAFKPFLVLIHAPEQAAGVRWTDTARVIARSFWPGPLTLALPAEPGSFPDGVMGEDGRVAVRASPHPFVRALTAAWGPVTSTSANAPGSAPAADADAVVSALLALDAQGVLILDGGVLPDSPPSTILAVDDSAVRVLREGAVPRARLEDQLAGTGIDVS